MRRHDVDADSSAYFASAPDSEPGTRPLYYAALCGFHELTSGAPYSILKYPQCASAEGGRCGTALNSASFVGHLWTVRSLLRHGVSVDVRFLDSNMTLFANLNLHDDNRNNPLTLAAHRGRVDIVRVLLERNADFKSQDRRGRTPLHDGSNYPFDHFQVAQLLLEHGANPNAGDIIILDTGLRYMWCQWVDQISTFHAFY
jgi:hypothetical protein